MKASKRKWMNLAVFENPNDAGTLDTFLQFHRVRTRTVGDPFSRSVLFWHPPQTMTRLQVRAKDLTRAMDFLNAGSFTRYTLQRALRCPACGSFKVHYPHLRQSNIISTLWFNIGIILRLTSHEACCNDCHHLWPFPAGKFADGHNHVCFDHKK